ncbi:glycerol kinase 5, partial [Asbolus verrucosus]
MLQSESYIASLDVGTTTIRCQIINSLTQIIGSSQTTVSNKILKLQVQLLYPKPGFVEINNEQLWEQILRVIKDAISDAQLTAKDIKCFGISTQRATFTTWRRDTGVPFHNFITWKDIRAKELCKELNSSLLMKIFRSTAYSLYLITRKDRFLTGSRMKIASNHVSGRLLWVIHNIPEIKEALDEDNVMFGTLETWLLYKFTNGRLHVSDISNASATGFFDPFVAEWSSWSKHFLGVPHEILPQVVANDFNFGSTAENIFGVSIPIRCVMADQSSSMIASSCFACDDIKVTLGTGAFLDVNTADKIHTSVTGIYPVIGETDSFQGFITEPSETSRIASSIEDSDGVYFIPAFSGLGPPINDILAGSGFMGIKPTTTKNHLVRSVLEGIIFRITLAYQTLKKERKRDYMKIIVDGGVSKNDFLCQMLADLIGICVERLASSEMSVLGVGFLAGISMGRYNR